MVVSWRTSLLLAAGSGWLASTVGALPAHHQSAASAPIVNVRNGSYAGVHSPEYNQDFFLGMPNATAYPPHCVGYGGDEVGYEISEDCLYLNVIRPAGIEDTAGLPVAVWIHGGGLYMGGSADRRYNLSFIVQNSVDQDTPMIGVSLNYRLSAFGFPSGKQALDAGITNLGFRDQRLALQWVNENIASFGGAPDKVTIWGESSGAESVSAQTLAYGGRDDGLFRGVIAESGYGGYIGRFPGGLNATSLMQDTYDTLVQNTTCADTVGKPESLDCLRTLPLDDLHKALNGTAAGPWGPVLDGDFIADYPSKQLSDGRFPKVSVLIGCNSEEGASFGTRYGPDGGVNTDDEMRKAIASIVALDVEKTAGKSLEQVVDELMYLYPDIQAVGVPGLDKWPIIQPGDIVAESMGLQYRRTAALFGDFIMQHSRRRASLAFAAHDIPSWSYRFDVVLPRIPGYAGATHFQEVAFVFDNIRGDGYEQNPFANNTEALTSLAKIMSTAWVNFITSQDPNGPKELDLPGLETWPSYNASVGGGVGENLVWTAKGSYVEVDSWRAEGINYFIRNSLAVFGI